MDSQQVQLSHEHVLVKEAATDVPTPASRCSVLLWTVTRLSAFGSHLMTCQETPRWNLFWSHKWDKFYRPQRFDGSALNKNDGLEAIPDINGQRDDYEILGWRRAR